MLCDNLNNTAYLAFLGQVLIHLGKSNDPFLLRNTPVIPIAGLRNT